MKQRMLIKNLAYSQGTKRNPCGIMVHSTGANNSNLSRYIGFDSKYEAGYNELIGVNQYKNSWNTPTPGGKQVCVHGFIGLQTDESVEFYQTIPFDQRAWHSGSGKSGNADKMGYIGFEICEDGLNDKNYFNDTKDKAVEICAELCSMYNLDVNSIICHADGYKMGIASNHADILHWWGKFGYTMDMFREEVKKAMNNTVDRTEPSEWAKTSWEKLKNKGATDGSNPRDYATREQLAVILDRMGLLE